MTTMPAATCFRGRASPRSLLTVSFWTPATSCLKRFSRAGYSMRSDVASAGSVAPMAFSHFSLTSSVCCSACWSSTLELLALWIIVGIRQSDSTVLSSHCCDCLSIVSPPEGWLEDRNRREHAAPSPLPVFATRTLISDGHGGGRGAAVHSAFSSPAPAHVTLAHVPALHEAVEGEEE